MATLTHDDRLAPASAPEQITGMVASGVPLRETLEELMRNVEGLTWSGMLGSILVLDEERRHHLHAVRPWVPGPAARP